MAVNQSFPAKIYQILENESSEIIRWNDDGQSFRIVDHGRFEREIVPKYFRHNQISSVQRQLNLYGFKCISRGELRRSFFHPKFKRGDWEVVKRLTRYVPPKKSTPYQEFGPTSNAEDNNMSEFAKSAANVVVMKEEPHNNLAGQQAWHSSNSRATLCAVASAAGLLPTPLTMPYAAPQSNASSVNGTPRSAQPSELAMRLGFNVMPKPSGALQANAAAFQGSIPNQSKLYQCHDSAASSAPRNGFTNCSHHGSNSDFDWLRDFDLLGNVNFADDHFEDVFAKVLQESAAAAAPAAGSSSGSGSSSDSVNSSVSGASATTEVVPVLTGPVVTKKITKDASCMTDLVYSEQHGGFIYASRS